MTLVSIGNPYEIDDEKHSHAQDVIVWRFGYHWTIGHLRRRKSCEMLDFIASEHYLGGEDGWKRSFRKQETAHRWLRERAIERYGKYEVN